MTTLPREATEAELNRLRSDGQSSRLYITIHQPATVFTARLAAVPSSTDQVTAITYNTGSGTYTNILADQTLYVGTSAGAYDLGMCRIRNTDNIGAVTGTFNIAEESEIDWQSSAYLTVKDEFSIWPRHIRLSGTTPYMDFDVSYIDENSACDSIPIMGPHRVLWLSGATVSTTFDATDSWALNNNITTYEWTFPGADSYSDEDTAQPTVTYDAAGVYRVALTVTNDDGVDFTGYRYVFVADDAEQQETTLAANFVLSSDFTLDSLSGDYTTGGWMARVTMYDSATLADIRDRALVIIHTRDTYGVFNESVGFVDDAENILFVGWIAGETIQRGQDDTFGTVSFNVEGVQYWLGRIPAFPTGLKDVTTTPTKWTRFWGLTPKAAVWHLLHWRTTITRCADVFPLDNDWRAARIEAPGAQTLWEQLNTIESTTVLAQPCGDRLGRLHNQIDQQYLNDTDRGAIPTVMTLEGQDIAGAVDIERAVVDQASIVDLSGVSFDGTDATAYFSLSPGRVFRRYGSAPEVFDRLVLYDQATTNTLCGRIAGARNNEYPRLSMMLGSNHRLLDIAPYSFYTYTVAAADTPRSIAETFALIPRRVSFEYNNDGGYFLTRVEFEAETEEDLAITGDAPEIVVPQPPPPPPPPDPPPPPIITNDAKILWLVHSSGASSPKYAVLYEVLDDYEAPVWKALIPPDDMYVDGLSYCQYFADTDVLMVIGSATKTPKFTGWSGGASHVMMRVTGATSGAPAWEVVNWRFKNGLMAGFDSNNYGANVVHVSFPTNRSHGHNAMLIIALGSNLGSGKCLVYPSTDAGGGYYIDGAQRYIYAGAAVYWQTMYRGIDRMVVLDGGTSYISGEGSDEKALLGNTTDYEYMSGYVFHDSDNPVSIAHLRRVKATNALQIVQTVVDGPLEGTLYPYALFNLDETATGQILAGWSNTLTPSRYANIIPYTASNSPLYYYIDGTWARADGTVPQGWGHYLKRAGGNDIMHVCYGAVSNGNIPAKFTTDITDLTTYPWTDFTGNMWAGDDKIMTSGGLNIKDSFLSF
jgi:hypothetical protein